MVKQHDVTGLQPGQPECRMLIVDDQLSRAAVVALPTVCAKNSGAPWSHWMWSGFPKWWRTLRSTIRNWALPGCGMQSIHISPILAVLQPEAGCAAGSQRQ